MKRKLAHAAIYSILGFAQICFVDIAFSAQVPDAAMEHLNEDEQHTLSDAAAPMPYEAAFTFYAFGTLSGYGRACGDGEKIAQRFFLQFVEPAYPNRSTDYMAVVSMAAANAFRQARIDHCKFYNEQIRPSLMLTLGTPASAS